MADKSVNGTIDTKLIKNLSAIIVGLPNGEGWKTQDVSNLKNGVNCIAEYAEHRYFWHGTKILKKVTNYAKWKCSNNPRVVAC